MDPTHISIITGAVAAILGTLALIAKNFDTLCEVYDRRIKQPSEQRKKERDDKSHRPIMQRLDQIEHETYSQNDETKQTLAEIKHLLEKNEQEKQQDRKITRASAMALVSLYTDISLKGEPNGSSENDINRLRDIIYL